MCAVAGCDCKSPCAVRLRVEIKLIVMARPRRCPNRSLSRRLIFILLVILPMHGAAASPELSAERSPLCCK